MEMIRRLGRNEKRLVRTQYGDNILFKAINVPAKSLERELNVLRISSEEVFLECLTILDEIKECNTGKEAEQVVDGVYNTLYCDLREISAHSGLEKELEVAVGEIVIVQHYLIKSGCCALYHILDDGQMFRVAVAEALPSLSHTTSPVVGDATRNLDTL